MIVENFGVKCAQIIKLDNGGGILPFADLCAKAEGFGFFI